MQQPQNYKEIHLQIRESIHVKYLVPPITMFSGSPETNLTGCYVMCPRALTFKCRKAKWVSKHSKHRMGVRERNLS